MLVMLLSLAVLGVCPPDCPEVEFTGTVPSDGLWHGDDVTFPTTQPTNDENGLDVGFGGVLPTAAQVDAIGQQGCWHLDVPMFMAFTQGGSNTTFPLDVCLDEDVAANLSGDPSKPMLGLYANNGFVTAMHYLRWTFYYVMSVLAWVAFVLAEMRVLKLAVS